MEPPSSYRVLISNDSGQSFPIESLRSALLSAMPFLGLRAGELSIRLASDEGIRALNREYRGIDAATDVLTFPANPFPTEDLEPLGDIAIAMGRARYQADARGIDLADEVCYLALHGLLHLTGLDDETDEEREHMLSEMSRIGAQLGLAKVESWHTLPAGTHA